MKKDKKEIRDLLLGKAVLDDDGKLITPEAGIFRVPQGIADGASAVRFLGVMKKAHRYETELGEKELMELAEQGMRNLGRALRLREQPDAAACLIRYVLTRPALLTFRYAEGHPLLTAWTGRGLTGLISMRRAIRAFEKELPEEIRRSAEEPPTEEKEPKEKKRRRNKQNDTPEDRQIEQDETAAASEPEAAEAPEPTEQEGPNE